MRGIHTILLLIMFFACRQTIASTSGTKLFRSDELTSTLVTKVEQDKLGFIWVATEYGLNRFDGYTYRTYFHNPDDATSLADNNVRNVVCTPDGSLWVCSSHLQRYNPATDSFDDVCADDCNAGIADVVACADSSLFAVGFEGEIYSIDTGSGEMRMWEEASLRTKGVKSYFICEAPDGTLLIGGQSGLMSINRTTLATRRYGEAELGHRQASGAIMASDSTLYIYTPLDVLRYDVKSGMPVRIPFCKPAGVKSVRCIAEAPDGSLLLGTFGAGAYRCNLRDCELTQIDIRVDHYNISSVNVSSLFADRDKNLWIGCFQKGVALVPHVGTSFTEIDMRGLSFDNHYPLSLIADAGDGEIWLGQGNNGLHLASMNGSLLRSYLPGTTPISMKRDSRGQLWVGLYDEGVGVLNTSNGVIDKLPAFPYNRVRAIDEDRQGNIYFAIFSYGIYSFNIYTGAVNEIPKEINSPKVMTLAVDSKGLLWVGGYDGLRCYDPATRKTLSIPYELGPLGALVNTITEDRKGDMWIATAEGLFHYHRSDNTFCRMGKDDGLPDDMVCDVRVAHDNEVWISTYKCLGCFKPATGQFIMYRKGNGLNGMAFLRSVGAVTADGHILFAYDDGYIHFNPSKIDEVEPLSPVCLSAISLPFAHAKTDDDTLDKSAFAAERYGRLNLDYSENVVELRFLSLDHLSNDNLCLQYRFSNRPDAHWTTCRPGDNSLQLGPLAPGRYDLEVRTTVNYINSPSRHYEIRVGHPWYSSWWMWCVYCAIIVVFIYQFVVGYNNYQIRKRNDERIKFFIDLTHELRSPTTLMLAPLQELVRRKWDEETGRMLRAMYRNGNRLLQLLNQILDVRKIDKGRMEILCSETDIVQYVRDVFHVFEYEAEKRHIRFTFTSDAESMPLYIDRAHFDKVVYNLLSNAFKFVPADGGEIAVELLRQESHGAEHVLIRVSDNGQGIDKEQVSKVFERFYQAPANKAAGRVGFGIGLNLCYNIVKLHHGSISVANRDDGATGAVFTISMPVGRDHLSEAELLKGESFIVSADPVKLLTQQGNLDERDEALCEPDDKADKGVRHRYTHTVLIADDDRELLDYLGHALSARYRVIACEDGAEALSKTIERLPDLVISDISMPKVDGFSLLSRLKNNSATSHIPVILLTSLSEHENKVEGLQKGADAYVEKPFDMEELMACVHGIISTRTKLKGKFTGDQEQKGKVANVALQGVNDKLMERVMAVINENFSDPELNVEMLAESVGLSRTQLHRRIKDITGLSCGDFIRNFRMQQAARLLREGDVYVSQICYAVGFANPTHFSTAFKKHFGVTPSEYVATNTK